MSDMYDKDNMKQALQDNSDNLIARGENQKSKDQASDDIDSKFEGFIEHRFSNEEVKDGAMNSLIGHEGEGNLRKAMGEAQKK